MERIYFVSGIDTGVGKTIATGMMGRFLRRQGIPAATVHTRLARGRAKLKELLGGTEYERTV